MAREPGCWEIRADFIAGCAKNKIEQRVAEKIFNFFATILLIAPLSDAGFSFGESLLISAVYVFLVGALIGWLYGKYKNKIK